jgi:predicted RNA binding protein YcfA (HicA-like mRNA interferase family)
MAEATSHAVALAADRLFPSRFLSTDSACGISRLGDRLRSNAPCAQRDFNYLHSAARGYCACDVENFAVLLPLVAVSGSECVDALLAAGFAVASRTGEHTSLAKSGRSVSVRCGALLMPEELLAILRDAGLAYSDFLDLLSEAPTDPDMRRPNLAGTASSSPPPR